MPTTVNLGVSPLAARTVSGFAISIGTSLALETLFDPRQPVYDPERKIPERVKLENYKSCWINLATLYRNIVGSIDRNSYLTVSPEELFSVLETEIEIIESLFAIEGKGLCRPAFYYCDYSDVYLKQKHQAVQLRHDRTDIQKHNTAKLLKTMQLFFKYKSGEDQYKRFNSTIYPDKMEASLVLSHVPYDLLSYRNFRRFDLLESHTGVLKTRVDWYTKFFKMPDTDLSTIPFHKEFLLIFGDNIMFSPMDIRFRRLIVDISKKRHWTSHTGHEKIQLDLDLEIKERYLFDLYKQLK